MTEQSAPTRRAFWVDPDSDPRDTGEPPVGEIMARKVYARYDDLGDTFIPGEPWEVRGVIVHLIEEYARHCGHADLLRECIDGRTGQ